MAWHLASDVSFAVCGDDLVFLDVAQDAYLCLPGGARVIQRTCYGLVILDQDLADELAGAGLVEARSGGFAARRPAPTASGDLRDMSSPALGLGDRLAFARSIAANTGRYHGRSLQAMIGSVAGRGAGDARYVGATPHPAIIRRAQVFERLLPWAPRQEACLYRSFMLLRFLEEHGRDANWVFGVRTRPFEAHCWVQAGGVVLNDTLDHVVTYAPILVT